MLQNFQWGDIIDVFACCKHLSLYTPLLNMNTHKYIYYVGLYIYLCFSIFIMQHIEDLTQEKFSLQRALEASRVLAESLATENSSLTENYNHQVGLRIIVCYFVAYLTLRLSQFLIFIILSVFLPIFNHMLLVLTIFLCYHYRIYILLPILYIRESY